MKKIIFIFIFIWSLFCFNFNSEASTSKPISGGIVDTNGTNLNVRSSASTSSSIKAKIKNDSYLTIYSTNGNFYYVEYKEGSFGYVHKNYVDIISTNVKKVSTTSGNLNVRYGPSTSYYKFDSIVNNDYVIILSDKRKTIFFQTIRKSVSVPKAATSLSPTSKKLLLLSDTLIRVRTATKR